MKNHWLNNIWCVEIAERAKHLYPDTWYIKGYYKDEIEAYYAAEAQWEKKRNEEWHKKWGNNPPSLLDQLNLNIEGEDYFHWHVPSRHYFLHTNGIWHKLLINHKHEFTGIYNSYDEAAEMLFNTPHIPPRFEKYKNYIRQCLK
jgi:hypothetical protein